MPLHTSLLFGVNTLLLLPATNTDKFLMHQIHPHTSPVLGALYTARVLCRAWVFLPNHYHALVFASDLLIVGEALRIVHSRVAPTVNFQQGQKGRRVWYRYTDRLIRSERHHWASLNYIHYNPIKHGYVKKATDWPWVSAHEYLRTHGREWLAGVWKAHPVRNYGNAWDN